MSAVEMLLLDNRCHMTGHQSANALSLTQPLANHRAADVDEGNLYESNVGKSGLHVIGIGILTGIDHDGVFPEKVFISIPFVEQLPVVAADKQGEAVLGEVFFQGLQGVPSIGRLWQMELVVAGAQPRFILQGELHQPEPLVVVEQLPVLLQRILW